MRNYGIVLTIMSRPENGGAIAIRGFNYQKSVIILIAVLHYLNEEDFSIQMETDDDIVVSIDNINTYIQVKGKTLGVGAITQRPDGKDSILEKNLATSDHRTSQFKIVAPNFTYANKHLVEAKAAVVTDGAEVFTYTEDAIKTIKQKLPHLSDLKLLNSKIAITSFKANQKASLDHLIGIMSRKGISVDNSYGMASLQELCLQIDQRSEKIVKNNADIELKTFTQKDLGRIFRHSQKVKFYEDIIDALNYTTMRKVELKNRSTSVGALYSSYVEVAKESLLKLDMMNMDEKSLITTVIEDIAFNDGIDELDKEAIIINAYGQILFEGSQA